MLSQVPVEERNIAGSQKFLFRYYIIRSEINLIHFFLPYEV